MMENLPRCSLSIEQRALSLLRKIPLEELQKISRLQYGNLPVLLNGNVQAFRGASRVVLVPKHHGFVIKMAREADKVEGERGCQQEKKLSKEIKEKGLEKYFACYLGEVNYEGRKYYIFEKFSNLLAHCENEPYVQDSKRKGAKIGEFKGYIKDNKIWRKLEKFLVNNQLMSDLHRWNVAFSKKRKHIVIVDYAGY